MRKVFTSVGLATDSSSAALPLRGRPHSLPSGSARTTNPLVAGLADVDPAGAQLDAGMVPGAAGVQATAPRATNAVDLPGARPSAAFPVVPGLEGGNTAAAVIHPPEGAVVAEDQYTQRDPRDQYPGTRAGRRHRHCDSEVSEFELRAATAWVRAADAGVIGASELGWLLDKLHKQQRHTGGADRHR